MEQIKNNVIGTVIAALIMGLMGIAGMTYLQVEKLVYAFPTAVTRLEAVERESKKIPIIENNIQNMNKDILYLREQQEKKANQ
jgi:hypothetical protein